MRIENNIVVESIKNGLISIIPILMIGAFALIIKTFPLETYQKFLKDFCDGIIYQLVTLIYNATFGLMSVYITMTISMKYILKKGLSKNYAIAGSLTAIICFFIFAGITEQGISLNETNAKGMFTALICSHIVSIMFVKFSQHIKFPVKLYGDGTDVDFNDSINVLIPALIVIISFAFVNYALSNLFGTASFQELYILGINNLLGKIGRTFTGGFIFVFLSSILWFFGIHGSDVLENVVQTVFTPGLSENINNIAAGKNPDQIITKQFFDIFVLMGGCGVALCLLISIFIFSKRKTNRNIAKIAAFPMIFNINEIMVFGLPIIYNPVMMIPFLLTPVVAFIISYGAMYFNLVPLTMHEVEWTTPIFFSGYKTTGSIRGSILQLVILVIGVLIYMPFIKLYDGIKEKQSVRKMNGLVDIMKKSEIDKVPVTFSELSGTEGLIARSLIIDIKYAIEKDKMQLYYQPQYNDKNECIGAEALLRYKHPVYGMMYPPLLIKLAQEGNLLPKLEKYIFTKAASDYQHISAQGKLIKISVNVTVATVINDSFEKFLRKLKNDYNLPDNEICIEITEQMAINSEDKFANMMQKIKQMGYLIAIDDFSMGYTSIKYLQSNQFDIVKMDGVIVKDMMNNPRSREIISSIIYLAESLNFMVIAEYVETEEQRESLKEIGCRVYQGYLYSPAVELNQFIKLLEK